jgi:hypothetical protein
MTTTHYTTQRALFNTIQNKHPKYFSGRDINGLLTKERNQVLHT